MRLILQFCLLLLVLLGAEPRAWGKVDVGQNIASGGLPLFLVDCTDGDAPPALITQGEPGPWDYEPTPDVCNGPNLYAYVKCNPWSAFDPEGLWLKEMLPQSVQAFMNQPSSSANAAVMAFNAVDGTIDAGIRTVGTYSSVREAGGTRAQAGVAAGVYGLGSVTGALSVAEAIDGNRIVSAEGGGVTTQGMGTGERVMQGALGAAQMGLGFVGASGGFNFGKPGAAPAPIKGQAAVVAESEAAAANKAVKPGQTGTYGDLKAQKRARGETEALDMDHQPSFAAQVAAREAVLGRTLTPAERAAVKASTPAVASPRPVHQQTSPTYGGRNTPSRIAEDAADLPAAAARDRAAFDQAMENR